MRLVNSFARSAESGKKSRAQNGRGSKRSKTAANKRRRQRPLLTWRRLKFSASALAVLTVLGGGTWLWQDGWFVRQWQDGVRASHSLARNAGLAINDLQVQGRRRTPPDTILETLGVTRGLPIFELDLDQARRSLEALPWIERASVERQLPDILFVRLAEREPMARWQTGGQVSLIDRKGKIIAGTETRYFSHLPLVVGPDAQHHAAELIAVLNSEPELRKRVTAAVWISERRWNIKLEGDINVSLPEGGLQNAWTQLANIEKQHGVLERDVVAIDLRLPDRLVIRTAPGAKPLTLKGGKGENT